MAISSFLEFCYLVRRNTIDEACLAAIRSALDSFHEHRQIFVLLGVRKEGEAFNLPRQHSMRHYVDSVREFGAPNGLCSSITESAHIAAVKQTYRRSSRYKALGQMLVSNERIEKLKSLRRTLSAQGSLPSLANVSEAEILRFQGQQVPQKERL